MAAQRCISARQQILDTNGGPSPSSDLHLRACDAQLQQVRQLRLVILLGETRGKQESSCHGDMRRIRQSTNQLQEVQQITDEFVYLDLLSGDQSLGRWTVEDPGLFDILNWLSTRL